MIEIRRFIVYNSGMLIIGHRGAAALLPENTLESLDLAIRKFGCGMVEFDVRLSKDNVPVIIHDAKVDRTTNGKGYVSQISLSELKKLDAGKGFKIPTFEELLSRYPDTGLAVEIKDNSTGLVHQVQSLIEKYKAGTRCVVGSKHHSISKELRKSFPAQRRFYSEREIFDAYLLFLKKGRLEKDLAAVASMPLEKCQFALHDVAFIGYLHQAGIKVFYWTVNDPSAMKMLRDRGADGIITDNPQTANQALGGEERN